MNKGRLTDKQTKQNGNIYEAQTKPTPYNNNAYNKRLHISYGGKNTCKQISDK